MKVTPLIFSAPMVRALLDNRKTQTRRIIKPQPPSVVTSAGVISSTTESDGLWWWLSGDPRDAETWMVVGNEFRCPWGAAGDLIYVKEAIRGDGQPGNRRQGIMRYAVDGEMVLVGGDHEGRSDVVWHYKKPVLSGRFLRREYSRITLRLTDVRVERVQDISEDDARAEGITDADILTAQTILSTLGLDEGTAVDAFRLLWNDINGPDAWARNDWVRALSYEVIKANVDTVLKEAV